MIDIILLVATSFLICIYAIPSIITVAKLKNLYDKPEERKIHTIKIPRLGGVAIFTAFAISMLIFGDVSQIEGIRFIAAAGLILFISGLKDDVVILSPLKKLLAQLLASGFVTVMADIRINDLHGVFGINEIPLYISILLSMFMIIVITNSMNLIDGADGLAGSLGLIISLTFAYFFTTQNDANWAILAFALSGALLGFLFFNFNPAKIFMGDAGSLTLGFLLSVFAIHFIESHSPGAGNYMRLKSAPGIAVAILIVPLYDTLRVFLLRAYKRTSPFKADKNHLHHWLMKIGLGHKQVSLILSSINLLFILIAYAIKDQPAYVVLSVVVGLTIIAGQLPVYIYRHKITDIEVDDSVQQEITQSLFENRVRK
jgi:UDP-N-acetylmuramyl pentapeptide phosphotransferase/UDP-N-acetylglucosamine-1-phosphate transferase